VTTPGEGCAGTQWKPTTAFSSARGKGHGLGVDFRELPQSEPLLLPREQYGMVSRWAQVDGDDAICPDGEVVRPGSPPRIPCVLSRRSDRSGTDTHQSNQSEENCERNSVASK
jgi:hypothetical protein